MRFVDLIEKKADGFSLSKEEIEFMVNGFTDGSIPDYQMSAMMMAILQKDMNDQETADLTMAMMHSGEVVDLSDLPGVKVGHGVFADNIFFVFHRSVRQVQGSHLDKLHIVLGNQVSSLHILFYLYHFHFSVGEAVDKRRNPKCDTESEDNTDNSYHRSVAGDSHFTFHEYLQFLD